MKFDQLQAFLYWWLQTRAINTPEVENPFIFEGGITGIVLYRQPPFQVQLFTVKPNSAALDHVHRFVDSFEVYLGGDIDFHVEGSETVLWNGHHITRVKPNALHGAGSGEKGCAFLSIQNWGDIKPTSISHDWLDVQGKTSGWVFEK